MAHDAPGSQEVVLNKRTLQIGDDIYQLSNLARVQTVPIPPPVEAGKGSYGYALTAGVIVWGVGSFILAPIVDSTSTVASIAAYLIAALMLVGSFAAAIFTYRRSIYQWTPKWALRLETTGNPRVALVSEDLEQLQWLSRVIVEAIESPPERAQHYSFNNVYTGDQYYQRFTDNKYEFGDHYHQSGHHNVFKQGEGER